MLVRIIGGISIALGMTLFHFLHPLFEWVGGGADVFFLGMVVILLGGGLYLLIRGRSALGED